MRPSVMVRPSKLLLRALVARHGAWHLSLILSVLAATQKLELKFRTPTRLATSLGP